MTLPSEFYPLNEVHSPSQSHPLLVLTGKLMLSPGSSLFVANRDGNVIICDKYKKIEITPEMMEAGSEALASKYFDLVDSLGYPEIVRLVFEAMIAKIEK